LFELAYKKRKRTSDGKTNSVCNNQTRTEGRQKAIRKTLIGA